MPSGARHVDQGKHHSLVGYALRRLALPLVGVLGLGLVVAGVMVYLDRDSQGDTQAAPPCPQHTLTLAADPAIADTLTAATSDLSRWLDDGQCLRVEVTSTPSAQTAADVARPAGRGLGSAIPDAWVAESSHWLDVAGATTAGSQRLAGADPASLGTSPIVVAVAADKAADLGWPDTQPTWSQLLATDAGQWRLGTPDPAGTAAGLAALLAAGTDPATLSTLGRRLELPSFQKQTPAAAVAAGELDAAPDSEADVVLAGGDVVAAYDPAIDASLDFPFVALTPDRAADDDKARQRDLATLRTALTSPETQALLAEAGLRGPDGTLPASYDEGDGVLDQPAAPALAPDAEAVTTALGEWTQVGRRSRLLVLVDRSGSMDNPLPGGTETKAGLAEQSVTELIDSSAPDSDIGLWTFTTGQGQEGIDTLVEVGSLGDPATTGDGTRRDQLLRAMPALAPDPEGGTPLYRAVLAAYAWSLDHYSFGRFNAVVVVTDGRDDDTTQAPIPQAQVLDTLRRQYDGMRPVPIITLAYGADADVTALRAMSDVTGGQTYQGLTQRQVAGMLTQALAGS